MKTIGIIGGMGPAATIDLYTKITNLTNAKCDQDHIHVIIDSYPQIPDRTEYIINKKNNPLPFMVESANRLKNAGCKTIIIACNTAHYFAEEIEQKSNVKIIHIAKIATKALKERFPLAKNIAIIATNGTKTAKIYDNILEQMDLNSIKIEENIQNNIMSCIYNGVKANKVIEYSELFANSIHSIKADAFIAACTEIPILLQFLNKELKNKFIDATEELAKEAIKYATEI